MITVAIVEDNTVMRRSFRQWIDAAPGFQCVFSSATAQEAIAEIPRVNPDVVLMDIHLPGQSALRARLD
jgi:DNA-binding NarL/FixJ family response regulator